MTTPLPTFVFWLCGCSALLLIALALPLWLGRVPSNRLYGARFAATLTTPEVWYAVNVRAGRDLTLIGVAYLAAICALAQSAGGRRPVPLLVVTAVFLSLLIANTIILRRAAARLSGTSAHRQARGAAS